MHNYSMFVQVRNEFYKDTQGALLVYDVSNRSSFEALSNWVIELRENLPKPSDIDLITFVVCANKVCSHTLCSYKLYTHYASPLWQVDGSTRKVDESEGRLWAETKGFQYFETSAQTGENVQEAFQVVLTLSQ